MDLIKHISDEESHNQGGQHILETNVHQSAAHRASCITFLYVLHYHHLCHIFTIACIPDNAHSPFSFSFERMKFVSSLVEAMQVDKQAERLKVSSLLSSDSSITTNS